MNFPCATQISCDCAAFGVSSELADCQGATGLAGPQGASGTPGVQTHFGSDFDPNGIVSGNAGDFYKSDPVLGGDGTLWTNRNGTNTGWT